jgi:hypothetical protein
MKANSHSVIVTVAAATLILVSCAASAEEPSESQMKEAMLNEMNHPEGTTKPAPITIKFFKKQGCDAPTPRGINCFFSVEVASSNIGASMYNNIPSAVFYKDGGKWAMRPPF